MLKFLGDVWFILLTFTIVILLWLEVIPPFEYFSLGESILYFLILCVGDMTILTLNICKEEVIKTIKENK